MTTSSTFINCRQCGGVTLAIGQGRTCLVQRGRNLIWRRADSPRGPKCAIHTLIRRAASVFNSFTIINTYTINYDVIISKSPYYMHSIIVLQYLLKKPKPACLKFDSWLNGQLIYFKVGAGSIGTLTRYVVYQ